MKAMIAGGGTGGHIYPALAIADGLKKKYPESEIVYVGSAKGLEKSLASTAGYKFLAVEVASLPRSISVQAAKSLLQNLKGMRHSRRLIKNFRPDLVVGTGGYACGPLMLEAAKMGVPTLLHEQNAVMGLTNRLLSKKVDKICLTFDLINPPEGLTDKMLLTGLPVRAAIGAVEHKEGVRFFDFDIDKPVILITGGSQGARHLNQAAAGCWRQLLAAGAQILHLTGKKLYAEMQAELQKQDLHEHKGIKLLPYLNEMEMALAAADLIIGRAGASFLAEVMVAGKASILVPYPYAAENHQEANARALERKGAATVIKDAELDARLLFQIAESLLIEPRKLTAMAEKAKALARTDALENILAVADELMLDRDDKKTKKKQ